MIINGMRITNSSAEKLKRTSPYFNLYLGEQEVIDALLECHFNWMFASRIACFQFDHLNEIDGFSCFCMVNCAIPGDFDYMRILITCEWEFREWNKPYKFSEFYEELEQVVKQRKKYACRVFDNDSDEYAVFEFKLLVEDGQQIISDLLSPMLSDIQEYIKTAHDYILMRQDGEIFTRIFEFPPAMKTSCKQYLIYFGQFLSDLGIEAEAEIREDANRTLLRVVPADKMEALENIHKALQIFLNAPSNPTFDTLAFTGDIAQIQWQSNVYHLKSQLLLANAILQTKEATIESLTLSNYQYKLQNEALRAEEHEKGEESVIDGILAVKKYEGKGFVLNLPEILRKLKRQIK